MGRGETKASSVDSLPDGDRGVHSLSPITGKDHPLSLILGLALVALVLTLHGIEEGMTTSFVVGVALGILASFGGNNSLGNDLDFLKDNLDIVLFIIVSFTNVFLPLRSYLFFSWTSRGGRTSLLVPLLRFMLFG